MFSSEEFKQKMSSLFKEVVEKVGEIDESFRSGDDSKYVTLMGLKSEKTREISKLFSEAIKTAETSDELDEIAIAMAEIYSDDIFPQKKYFREPRQLSNDIAERKKY